MSVVHFLLVDFGEGQLLVPCCCEREKPKSTPSPTDFDCTVRLDWSLTKPPEKNLVKTQPNPNSTQLGLRVDLVVTWIAYKMWNVESHHISREITTQNF